MADPKEIRVGDRLGSFQRATGFQHWNRYAAVNDEFVPIHMDDEAGLAAGYPSAFGMGNLQWAYLHNLLRQWMGESGDIAALSCQFRGANTKGQTVTAEGTVTALHPGGERLEVEVDVWTEEQNGSKLAVGKATVVFDVVAPQDRSA